MHILFINEVISKSSFLFMDLHIWTIYSKKELTINLHRIEELMKYNLSFLVHNWYRQSNIVLVI